MNELKEIRIGESIVNLKDNLVRSAILPKNSSQLERDVEVQSNVKIEGAVYGRKVVIDSGPAEFEGALYAHQELHIKNDSAGVIIFRKSVASGGSVVSLLVKGQVIYGADINAKSVKLKNCFVAGSIFAEDIQLENSVVLGGVFASTKLSLHNVVAGTFNAPEVAAGAVNYLLYPTAFSVEPIAPLPGTEFYNITLADLGALYKNETEKPNTGKIPLNLETDSQRTVLVDDAGTKILLHSYSVAPRVLVSDLIDVNSLENHFLILGASLGSQILKTYSLVKSDGGKSEDLTLENIARFFFCILSGSIVIQDLSGKVSFEELRKKYL